MFNVESANQKLVTEHLQRGYDMVHNEMTKHGMVYLLGKEFALSDKIDIVVIKEGKVGFNSKMTEQQIAVLAAGLKR